jgi:hypothetical protein
MILEKSIWTNDDYHESFWHDNKVHAMAFDDKGLQLLFDIDYIVQWIQKGKHFEFWIAPCTLVFDNVQNIEMDLEDSSLTIDSMLRTAITPTAFSDHRPEYDWDMVGTSGEIWFRSTGYTQYARRQPVLTRSQNLTSDVRGGISFSKGIE